MPEQNQDGKYEAEEQNPLGPSHVPRQNISASASRALKRCGKTFLNRHQDGRQVTIHIPPDHTGRLGIRPGDRAFAHISEHGEPRELVIRKVARRGFKFQTRADGWVKLTVRFEAGMVSELFAGMAGHMIPSEVELADDVTLRIVLADTPLAPTTAPPQPEPPDTTGDSSEAGEQAQSPARSGESRSLFSLPNPPDHLQPDPEPRSPQLPARGYSGVVQSPAEGRWNAIVWFDQRTISVGGFPSQHEAAYAHNLAERLLYGEVARLNSIPIEHQPGTVRQIAITMTVEHRLRRSGALAGPIGDNKRVSEVSGYRGVSWHRASKRWASRINYLDRCLSLGYYATRHEAASAYNHAASLLHAGQALLNVVLAEDLPSVEVAQAVRAKVLGKLRTNGAVPPERPSS